MDACETCRWWGAERAHDADQPYGRCRVAPPVIHGTMMLVNRDGGRVSVDRGYWPWVAFDDWCKSHEKVLP